MVEYWLLGEGAQPPQRHQGVALDLKARIPGRGWRLYWGFGRVPTGVALHIPESGAVRITGRSGNFLKGIMVHDGLVESEFDGNEVCALIFCPWPRVVRDGDRIAQMWSIGVDREGFRCIQEPPRGVEQPKGGFGSTGR